MTKKKETWQALRRRTKELCSASYKHAMRHEPYSEYPGVDIDRIHRRRELRKAQ